MKNNVTKLKKISFNTLNIPLCVSQKLLIVDEITVIRIENCEYSNHQSVIYSIHFNNLLDKNIINIELKFVKKLFRVLPYYNNLITFNLSSNIDNTMVKILCQNLPFNIKILNLSNCKLTIENLNILSINLLYLNDLNYLNLADNNICRKSIDTLANNIYNYKSLVALVLNDNPLYEEGIQSLASGLSRCKKLITLSLNNTNLNYKSAHYLAPALTKLKNIKILSLSYNTDFFSESMKILASALVQCKELIALDLSSNNLYNSGGKYLAEVLPQLKNITTLILQENYIGKSIDFIIQSLPKMPKLINLNIINNQISCKQYEDLTNNLLLCKNLYSLETSECRYEIDKLNIESSLHITSDSIPYLITNKKRYENLESIDADKKQEYYLELLNTTKLITNSFATNNFKGLTTQNINLMLENKSFIENHIDNDTKFLQGYTYFSKYCNNFIVDGYEKLLDNIRNDTMVLGQWSSDKQYIVKYITSTQLFNQIENYKNLNMFKFMRVCKNIRNEFYDSYKGSAFECIPQDLIPEIMKHLIFKESLIATQEYIEDNNILHLKTEFIGDMIII